jgi:hypothetical protein
VLWRFLARRFGTALDQFDEQIAQLDLAAITQLSEAAFEADTLAEFEVKLAELIDAASTQSDLKSEAQE